MSPIEMLTKETEGLILTEAVDRAELAVQESPTHSAPELRLFATKSQSSLLLVPTRKLDIAVKFVGTTTNILLT